MGRGTTNAGPETYTAPSHLGPRQEGRVTFQFRSFLIKT